MKILKEQDLEIEGVKFKEKVTENFCVIDKKEICRVDLIDNDKNIFFTALVSKPITQEKLNKASEACKIKARKKILEQQQKKDKDYAKELQKDKPSFVSQMKQKKTITLPMTRKELEKLDYDQMFFILNNAYIRNQIPKEFYIDLIENCGGVVEN